MFLNRIFIPTTPPPPLLVLVIFKSALAVVIPLSHPIPPFHSIPTIVVLILLERSTPSKHPRGTSAGAAAASAATLPASYSARPLVHFLLVINTFNGREKTIYSI